MCAVDLAGGGLEVGTSKKLDAFFEYCFQVPANRIGFAGNGGSFSLVQLKVIQEVVSISVFVIFTLLVFRTETFRFNHLIGFVFLILAVFFIFKPN